MFALTSWPVLIALFVVAISLVLVFVRLVLGPTLPDRVVALDMLSVVTISLVALIAIITGQAAYLDAAIILALISFLATIAFARYVEAQAGKGDHQG